MAKKPEHKRLPKIKKRGNKKAKAEHDKRIDSLLKLLFDNEEMTFEEMYENLKVSKKTVSDYIERLENERKIERIHCKGKRLYRIKPESRMQVKFTLDKLLVMDLIYSLDYPDVLHFLQDFTMDLIMHRKLVEGSKVDLEALVEEAKKSTFEILSKSAKP
jgi:DNA-binding Lrp family transcriptional regulator